MIHVIKFKMAFECRFFNFSCMKEVQTNVNFDDLFWQFSIHELSANCSKMYTCQWIRNPTDMALIHTSGSLFKSILFWFHPKCSNWSFFSHHWNKCQNSKKKTKRTICIVYEKVGVYSGTAFVHDILAKKIQKCIQTMRFTSLILSTLYFCASLTDILYNFQVLHTSNVNYNTFFMSYDDIKCLYALINNGVLTKLSYIVHYCCRCLHRCYLNSYFFLFIKTHSEVQIGHGHVLETRLKCYSNKY